MAGNKIARKNIHTFTNDDVFWATHLQHTKLTDAK